MKKIKNQLCLKLSSNAGESLAETLISTLIAALALVMLAGAISATANIIKVSDKQMGKYYDRDAVLVAMSSPESGFLSISIERGGTEIEARSARYCKNEAFSSHAVVAYKVG